MSVPSFRNFRYNTLKKVFEKLHDIFEKKIMDCKMVALIVDIWKSITMADYVAVAALIVNSKLEREVVVLGMEKPEGSHIAADVQKAIKKNIDRYRNFDKNKIKGTIRVKKFILLIKLSFINLDVVCDEGSEFVNSSVK